MREPAFWHRPPSWTSRLLSPFAAVYGAVASYRMARTGADAGIPVVCVGNYHVGGAGKTPTVIALARMLTELGERPFVLSRGYGGRLRGPVAVDPAQHSADQVGDEPLLIADVVPVMVARDRVAGAAMARQQGATVILMDDGFQNPSLVKDACLIVIDGNRGLGNARVIPAGPLRAPMRPQLACTDMLIVVGEGAAADGVAATIAAEGGLVRRGHLQPDEASAAALRGKRVLAFAGIGDPARFFETMRRSGVDVVEGRAFRDHHIYSPRDLGKLVAEAERRALLLVTTEKDLARLHNRPELAHARGLISAFGVRLRFDDVEKLRDFVAGRIARARTRPADGSRADSIRLS